MAQDTEKADWAQFERAVDQLAKTPPMHRKKMNKPQPRRVKPKQETEKETPDK